ncbi:xanthine phosphoribosyltransferase [Anaeromicrobium sediminis]|uniref:Xanthine phosphoribosyltransferase n=1 Tax=Anaeromicrobium sediminis TaxID=1478221 RepID=A0A267MID5_9FIRM|nr:xanthine phosphoribosyltransferase [Anaeromicrobium sediminis]PAB58560.1 xanthine phosphoribosyltransferase [Anaeromicrobium sediminis]
MESLKNKIRKEGKVLSETVLKVDCFLNHQIDSKFMLDMGKEFARLYKDKEITKIVTIETSGIAPAVAAGIYLDVPVVFAKKSTSSTLNNDTYSREVKSFTKNKVYNILIAKEFLNPNDKVLVIDDFLAYGNALVGLNEIIEESGATVVGAGIVIEKGFQPGGKELRQSGLRVESLAIIESMNENGIIFG